MRITTCPLSGGVPIAFPFCRTPTIGSNHVPRFPRKEASVDLNLIVIAGRVAAQPDVRTFSSGSSLLRILVTVRSESPRRRVDVIPVSIWEPDQELLDGSIEVGASVWVAGSVQRRFWSATDGRRSRLEVVAHDVVVRTDDEASEGNGLSVV